VLTFSKNKIYILVGVVVLIIILGVVFYFWGGSSIEVVNDWGKDEKPKVLDKSPLTAIACENAKTRPFAIMVSSDKEARPLSGISEADWVFEMPVVENGFTRMMAVFQCGRPTEVGSVRSSRLDFVPLALGMNAIYAHFGGEKTVLDELNNGIIDNIDGLTYDGIYYYRKPGIARPHNAFTDFENLTKVSRELGYNMTDSKVEYLHDAEPTSQGEVSPPIIFNEPFQVSWKYDKAGNVYYRSRAGSAEVDKNTGKTVSAKNVVIMKTTWSPINADYIRVKTVGSGGLLLYKNGIVITGTWEKKDDKAKLFFYDQNHKEIGLGEGNVWVEIVTN